MNCVRRGRTSESQFETEFEIDDAQPSSDTACPPGAAWCRDYDYDAYGNRAVVGSAGPTLKMATPTDLGEFNTATNRIAAGQYDPAGNLLSLAHIGVVAYDANNKFGFR